MSNSTLVARLSKNLRRLRDASGLTQHELAKKAGLSRGAVAKLEGGVSGGARTCTLSALAQALECTIDDLVAARKPTEPATREAA
jgi:transcriptional regulator with XRE-family HTH domain